MKLVIGLGNPGKKYENTRHNAGFLVIDRLVGQLQASGYALQDDWKKSEKGKLQYYWFQADGEKIELIKPTTFMNESGYPLSYVMKKHRDVELNNVWVVHDDLDIKLGEFKIQKGKGPKDHKGILSIEKELGKKGFNRVRIGVENRPVGDRIPGEDYVLTQFTPDEIDIINKVVDRVVYKLITNVLT